jgi:hypothetical protein
MLQLSGKDHTLGHLDSLGRARYYSLRALMGKLLGKHFIYMSFGKQELR